MQKVKTKMDWQIENETLYHPKQLHQRVIDYFKKEVELLIIIKKNKLDLDTTLEFIYFMWLVQHANIDMLVGHMLRFFDNVQECCDWIDKAIDYDLVDYNGKSFSYTWTVTKQMEKEFALYQYPLPMLVEPKEIKYNSDSPHITIDKESVFCGDSFHTNDVCLDVINKQNKIRLILNTAVVDLTKNQWKKMVGGRKPDESREHWEAKVKQFEKYDRSARKLMEEYKNIGFYIPKNIDKRGRIYDQGYFITGQGTDWNKGMIELANGEYLEEE